MSNSVRAISLNDLKIVSALYSRSKIENQETAMKIKWVWFFSSKIGKKPTNSFDVFLRNWSSKVNNWYFVRKIIFIHFLKEEISVEISTIFSEFLYLPNRFFNPINFFYHQSFLSNILQLVEINVTVPISSYISSLMHQNTYFEWRCGCH